MIFRKQHICLTGIWILQAAVSFTAQAVIAAYFGTSADLDAYLVGTTIPTTIYMVTSSALVSAVTLYFNRVKVRDGEAAACQSVSGLLIMTGAGGILLGTLLYAQADRVVTWTAPGLSSHVTTEALRCLQLTTLSVPFLMMYSLLSGLLNAQRMFLLTTIASMVLVGLIPLPILLGRPVSPESLAWGFNAAAFGAWILLFTVGLHIGYLRKGPIWWTDWREALSISLPPLGAAAFTHALWLSERYFASSLDPGIISALNYGQRIVNFIAGGFTFATSTILLPYLSAWIEAGDRHQAAEFNRKTMFGTLICAVAGLLLLIGGGEWLVRLAYARGQFDEASIDHTTTAVWLYLGCFVAYLYAVILTKNAMAMNEKKVLVITSSIAFFSYILITPFLIKTFGYGGLPLSSSIAMVISVVTLFGAMWRNHPDFYRKPAEELQPERHRGIIPTT
jgi:putative peptidoglycan lipid II flippase